MTTDTDKQFLESLTFSGDKLLPHQVEQALAAVIERRPFNVSETGTGKFRVALAARKLAEHRGGHILRTLYTCPKTALGQFEIEMTENGYIVCVIRSGADVIPEDADTVLIANSNMLPVHREQLRAWDPAIVVLDEGHAFKNAQAARTKAVYGELLDRRGGIVEGADMILVMSGTLAPNTNAELYPHLRALAPETLRDDKGRIQRRHGFEQTYCAFAVRYVAGGQKRTVIVASRNSDVLRGKVAPYAVRATLREIAPFLPPERHEYVAIDRADVRFDEMAEIAGIDDEEVRAAVTAIAKAITTRSSTQAVIEREIDRLMEIIGGGEAMAHLRRAWGMAKIPYVEEAVTARLGRNSPPTLVFNIYRATGDRLEEVLAGQGIVVGRIHGGSTDIHRKAVVSGIQDGTVKVGILQIEAAGSALNLQRADRVIMLEPSWAPGVNAQGVARAVRLGQENPVLCSWPYIRGSIDESVLRVLQHKQRGLNTLWRAVG